MNLDELTARVAEVALYCPGQYGHLDITLREGNISKYVIYFHVMGRVACQSVEDCIDLLRVVEDRGPEEVRRICDKRIGESFDLRNKDVYEREFQDWKGEVQ